MTTNETTMTRDEWKRLHRDRKCRINGKPHVLKLDRETQATVLVPVTITKGLKETTMNNSELFEKLEAARTFRDQIAAVETLSGRKHEAWTRTDNALFDLVQKREDRRKALQGAMRSLADRLAREADRLELHGSAVNTLGEVQGRGSEVDRLCGEFGLLREATQALAWAVLRDAQKAKETDPEACPGCGCKPGDGLTDGCEDAAGCGFLRGEE